MTGFERNLRGPGMVGRRKFLQRAGILTGASWGGASPFLAVEGSYPTSSLRGCIQERAVQSEQILRINVTHWISQNGRASHGVAPPLELKLRKRVNSFQSPQMQFPDG